MKTWSQLFLQTNLLLALGFAPAFTSAQTLAKVAVLQWSPPPARVGITAAEAEIIKQANRVTLGNFAIDAAKNGALLVIFPEFSVVGYPDIPELPPEEDEFRNREEIAPYVETASGNTFKYFSKIAAENHIAIHVGFAEVDPNDQKYYNGTLVIDSNGKRLASYRKINLYQGENNFLSRGTKPITYKSKFGVVALGTCSDIYSANLLQTYKASKTKVFAVGMSWAAHGGPMGSAAHAARTLNAHVLISNNDYFPGTGIFNPDGSTQALTVEQNGLVYGSVPVVLKKKSSLNDTPVRIALVQYPIQESIPVDAFQAKVRTSILQAKASGAELVVFPELIALDLLHRGTVEGQKTALAQIARDYTPLYFEWIKTQARDSGMIILGGSFPRLQDKSIRNTAVMAFPDGRMILQDKLFLTPDERAWGWAQGTELKLNEDKRLGRFVVTICYDSEFPQVSAKYASFQPDLILIPSMTGQAGLNRVKYAALARAVEHFAYVAATGTVDPGGANYVGQALVAGPQDVNFSLEPVFGERNVSALLVADMDLSKVRKLKATAEIYPGRDFDNFPNLFEVCDGILSAKPTASSAFP